uniref:Archipelago n=2 Tax=Schistosoma japonicum TaxID=6182 RepID=C1LG35_SCHJA|nr:archipelago [Schistosoma japonicum]
MSYPEISSTCIKKKRCPQPVCLEKFEKDLKYSRLSDSSSSNDLIHVLSPYAVDSNSTNILNELESVNSSSCGNDRLARLSALIDQCSHGELLHIKKTIKPLLKRDFITHLPVEVSLHILKYLSPRDIFHCAQVSKNWRCICDDNLLWYHLCLSGGLFSSVFNKSTKTFYLDTQPNCLLCLNKSTDALCNETKCFIDNSSASDDVNLRDCSADLKIDHIQTLHIDGELTSLELDTGNSSSCFHINKVSWKSLYRQDLHTQCNWRNGGPWHPVIVPAHHNHVITCLEVYEEWAITGSDDSSICIWDINTGQCLINLFGHLGGVWSMTVIPRHLLSSKKQFCQHPLLISGSCDRTARVWQLDGQRWPCIATLFGHQSTVRCLASQKLHSSPRFVAANSDVNYPRFTDIYTHGNDGTITIDDNDNNDGGVGDDESDRELTHNMFTNYKRNNPNHDKIMRKTASSGNRSNSNGSISNRSFDPTISHDELNPTIEGIAITHQAVGNAYLVVTGSRDTTLRLWNVLSGECLQEFRGHRGAIRCVQFTGDQIVSGSYDCTIRLWCALQGHCLRVFSAHTNRVYTLLFDGYHIISGSLDTTIRIWNAHTGALKQTFYGHRSLTSELAFGSEQNILVSSNADETIRVWHMNSGKCVHVLAGPHKHQSAVTCVQLTRNYIISSGDDGTVKLWDKQTGAYIRDLLRLDGAGRGGVIWRIVASEERLICAAGSRIGMEPTKLVILQFQEPYLCSKHLNNSRKLTHICHPRHKYAPEPRLSQIMYTNLGTM